MPASESRSAIVLQLAEEFLERYRQGQRPSLKEYMDRHPELAAEIKEVFPAMALMENVALADESLAGEATGPATPAGAQPPQQLGDYRILREVGRGGMGIVYEAEQVSLGRHVALKVLPRKVLLDEAHKRRFEREARSAAKLHHTNIVPVFGVGEHEGLPYYVMQFIQGLGLDEVLDELKRLQSGGTPTATDGQLRAARKDVSAVEVTRALVTGAFESGAGGVSPLSQPQGADAPRAADSGSASGRLSDSFTLSSSLQSSSASVKGKKLTYWQSVARLGVQMADALEYAHKQGIQHRDIKPSNLLLDTCGTVWVTDFGLARADNEDHLTQTGDIVGTLRYMPPEAFEGRADKRGDIYSLGLTLFELLAFQPAFAEKDRHKLIKRVTTEEPTRLDKLNQAIPRDLVTVIQKAIDREPGRRYQTAGALAADLQRFLDDEPIQARRISNRERLWRWCRHHPGVATLTAALAVLLLGVTVASLLAAARFDWLAEQQAAAAESERRARRLAEETQEHESALREQEEKAKKQAVSNLREAEAAKRQAEFNFAKARKAVDDYFTTVSQSHLLKVPGMQPLRRDLLQSALTFYQDFLKERGDDPALRGELAAAYFRVGKLRAEMGETAEARKAREQARALYEALTKTAPESVEWRHGLAQCYRWLDRNDEAIALWEKLVQPGQTRFQKELAEAYNARGADHHDAARMAEALQAFQKSLSIREMLVRLNPDDPEIQCDLGMTLNNIGVLLDKKGRREEALGMFRRAAEHSDIAFARTPQAISNGHLLAVNQRNIASTERKLEHSNEALAAYRRVVEVRRKLARDNPAVPYLHSYLFGAYRYLAQYQRELKQTEQAEQTMRLAYEGIERLPRDGPDDLFFLACVRAECAAFSAEGKVKRTAQEQAEQKQEADLAMESLRKAVAVGFRDVQRLREAKEFDALRKREDFKALEADLSARTAAAPADKLKAIQQALALRQKMVQADPKNKRLQADLAASQHAIALIQLDFGRMDEVQKHLDQALVLREALVKGEAKNAQYQADLAASRLYLHLIRARRFAEQKRNEEAEADLAKIEVFPADDAQAYKERGRTYFALGQGDKAAADFRKAVELLNDNALEALALPSKPASSEADKLLARLADDALLPTLTAAVERNPQDMARRWNRGQWYARHARWKEAAADLTKALEFRAALESVDMEKAFQWLYVAAVLAAAGDRDGYFRLCRELRKRFAETQAPGVAERLAKTCLLLPEVSKEMDWAYQLADLAVVRGKNHGYTPWFIFCKGLADYRRGNFRAAIEGLEPILPKDGAGTPELTTGICLVLALAHYQKGEEKVARQHLSRAAKLLEKYLLDPVRAPILKNSQYHHDWLIAWLLHREAQTLIEPDKLKASLQALAQSEKLAQVDPKSKRLQADLAATHHAIAMIQFDDGKREDARERLEKAVALREALVKDEPKNAQYQADLAASRLYLHLIRARRFAEQKRNKEAEAALTKIDVFPSNHPQVYKERGWTYFALGQTDKAVADFRKAAELLNVEALEALALPSEPAASEADKLLAGLADDVLLRKLTAAIERTPQDMAGRWRRGEWYARHARWKEAAADFTAGLEARIALASDTSGKAEQWLYVAPVLAIADRENYRRLCREMLKRFGETQDPAAADRIAKSCLLLPQLGKEMEQACELADRAVAQGKKHSAEFWFIFCKGLADYRRGNFRAAIEALEPRLPKDGDGLPELTADIHLVLAMARYRQGEEMAAREHLTRAAKLLDRFLVDPARSPLRKDSRYHHDWPIAWLLHREAKTLIEGEKGKSKK